MNMTVAQLIELLQTMPMDAPIVIDNQECKNYQYAYNAYYGDESKQAIIYVMNAAKPV